MILIALSWFILFFFCLASGIAVKSILKLESSGNYIPIFLGIFAQCLGLSICSFFLNIGIEVFLGNFIFVLTLSIWKSAEIKKSMTEIISDIRSLTTISKYTLSVIFLFSLFKCSQFSFIVDNDSYYVQTIKWINEYGFVKGLGNLHIYLGQTSPFHVLQAGFNFNFLTERSNDINGFLLNLSSLYFLKEFENRYQIDGKIHWIGFVLIFNILFFQFINAPSPDLILILFSQLFFYYLLDQKNTFENSKIIILLFLNLVFIKITIAPLILILLYQLYENKKSVYFFIVASSFVGTVLCLKNLIITGYPLYPLQILPLEKDWTIPKKLLGFAIEITENAGYFKNTVVKNASYAVKLQSWIFQNGINRIFNIGILLLLLVAPLVKGFKNQKKYYFLYGILVINFTFLLFSSPQYRFFLPIFVFLFAVVSRSLIIIFKIPIRNVLYCIFFIVTLPLVFTEVIGFPNIQKNILHQEREKSEWNQIWLPKKNSKFSEIAFEKVQDGNLQFFSPTENFFFYGTANGKLPCVNKVQVDYLKKKYHFKPQLRTSNLGDGFYSKNIPENE